MGEVADLFHSDPSWDSAVENLRGLEREYGEEAQARALSYAAVYDGAGARWLSTSWLPVNAATSRG